ncbi:MAG: hypothetical protein KF797_11975, partial [Flavobacteriales bacterium]|nr:hypothetical protein [Flavobacteriales bacterium]
EGVLHAQLALDPAHRDVPAMIGALRDLGVQREAEAEVLRLEANARASLDTIDPTGDRTAALHGLAIALRERTA